MEISENYSHEFLTEKPKTFPELFDLEKLINESNLVDSNYILECDSKSEAAMTRLIFLSSIIPTFMLEKNLERCKNMKEKLNVHVKKIVDTRSEAM